MEQTMVIIRGLPGSGKSTYAEKVREEMAQQHDIENSTWDPPIVCEDDQFFTDQYGKYNFNSEFIVDAHEWCRLKVLKAVMCGHSVIISNTFVLPDQMRPYFDIADRFKIPCELIAMRMNYGSIHGVPDEIYAKMAAAWEPFPGEKSEWRHHIPR